jgi:predicted DNA-binding transcriptional regulator AlpA
MSTPKPVRAVPAAEGRIGESLATIERAIQASPLEELPSLAAALAGLSARIALRLTGNPACRPLAEPQKLLSAAEVAEVLRISEGEVYRRSRSDLKPSAVVLGPGTLRFDPARLQKFIRSRTG